MTFPEAINLNHEDFLCTLWILKQWFSELTVRTSHSRRLPRLSPVTSVSNLKKKKKKSFPGVSLCEQVVKPAEWEDLRKQKRGKWLKPPTGRKGLHFLKLGPRSMSYCQLFRTWNKIDFWKILSFACSKRTLISPPGLALTLGAATGPGLRGHPLQNRRSRATWARGPEVALPGNCFLTWPTPDFARVPPHLNGSH